jgi:hypothetical protein
LTAAALGNGAIGFFFFEFHGVQMAYALSCAVALSVLGSQFTRFTGTKVQILTLLRRRAERLRFSVYLLYWYKSTNTDSPAPSR